MSQNITRIEAPPLFSDYPPYLLDFAVFCCVLFIVVGVPANLVTIIALVHCKKVHNATAVFLINLAVSDLMLGVFNLPLAASLFIHRAWVHAGFLCILFPFLRYGLVAVSVFTVLAITINRYVMIAHPKLYHRLYTRTLLALMVISTWIGAFGALIPTVLKVWGTFGLDPIIGSCTILPDSEGRSPKEFLFVFMFVLPCLAICVCYARIFCIVHIANKRSHCHGQGVNSANNKQCDKRCGKRCAKKCGRGCEQCDKNGRKQYDKRCRKKCGRRCEQCDKNGGKQCCKGCGKKFGKRCEQCDKNSGKQCGKRCEQCDKNGGKQCDNRCEQCDKNSGKQCDKNSGERCDKKRGKKFGWMTKKGENLGVEEKIKSYPNEKIEAKIHTKNDTLVKLSTTNSVNVEILEVENSIASHSRNQAGISTVLLKFADKTSPTFYHPCQESNPGLSRVTLREVNGLPGFSIEGGIEPSPKSAPTSDSIEVENTETTDFSELRGTFCKEVNGMPGIETSPIRVPTSDSIEVGNMDSETSGALSQIRGTLCRTRSGSLLGHTDSETTGALSQIRGTFCEAHRGSLLGRDSETTGAFSQTDSENTGALSQIRGTLCKAHRESLLGHDSETTGAFSQTDSETTGAFSQTDSETAGALSQIRGTLCRARRGSLLTRQVTLSPKDRRLLKMILVIFLSFVACYLPITLVKTFSKDDDPVLNILGLILIYLTTCINPIIYVVMSSEYRQAYLDLLACHTGPDVVNCSLTKIS